MWCVLQFKCCHVSLLHDALCHDSLCHDSAFWLSGEVMGICRNEPLSVTIHPPTAGLACLVCVCCSACCSACRSACYSGCCSVYCVVVAVCIVCCSVCVLQGQLSVTIHAPTAGLECLVCVCCSTYRLILIAGLTNK